MSCENYRLPHPDESTEELKSLLEMDPDVATKSNSYANSVVRLARKNADLMEHNQKLNKGYEEILEDKTPEIDEKPLEQAFYTDIDMDEIGLDSENYPSPTIKDLHEIDDYGTDFEPELEGIEYDSIANDSYLNQDESSETMKKLQRELDKGPADANLDKVRMLAEREYQGNH